MLYLPTKFQKEAVPENQLSILKAFLEDLVKSVEPSRVQYVLTKGGRRNVMKEVFYLSADNTKRELYSKFVSLLPSGVKPISQSSFLKFWRNKFRNLKIHSPRSDVCDDCFLLRNPIRDGN
eukprot:Pompholyxophrys_punicea_v1_NODE_763_length_1325_cov_145.521260.p2 type:complete len:121 gc:universal NODE_763_length_1325_cov_145.521260:407-45(-)